MSKAENVINWRPKELDGFVRELSLVRGDITLASGKKSDHYFNMKPLMMNPKALQAAARALAEKIPESIKYIGGLEMGAVPLTAAVLALDETGLCGFFVRKAPKEHGLKKRIEGLAAGVSLQGQEVVMLEDVTTTGSSALGAAKVIEAEGAVVKAVITLLDREEGAAENFAKANIDFIACLTKSDIL
jgi:orotate phosphoribosyltransferase